MKKLVLNFDCCDACIHFFTVNEGGEIMDWCSKLEKRIKDKREIDKSCPLEEA